MTSEITYAEVRFQNQSNSSDANSDPPAAPKEKTSPQKSNSGFTKQLLVSLLILLLLLAISFFTAFIIFFQRYSQIPKEKTNAKIFHEKLTCEKRNLTVEGKSWDCCPEKWIAFNTSCYFISPEAKSWNESEKNCCGMGAHLLVINTVEEQKLILTHVQQEFAYYLGLSDPEGNNDQWQWIDHSPYNKNVKLWHPGEPSNPKERCVTLNYRKKNWGWNDINCKQKEHSICKMLKIYL
ncbi:PREDICTED: C-type lectin domain family 4 member A isoform X1 [Chrysochloris asiatica]|uniref:C-type lectin domain family 4 member A isoform X1 n=1 Tax=Chrysochloris asiatica TaxID=185453 RepID=A0A9B0U3Y2_CHRAS|nr:PREDICTED: C-type lectin domain family 4 member A isoform X1 [Chrysochloris asiatica]